MGQGSITAFGCVYAHDVVPAVGSALCVAVYPLGIDSRRAQLLVVLYGFDGGGGSRFDAARMEGVVGRTRDYYTNPVCGYPWVQVHSWCCWRGWGVAASRKGRGAKHRTTREVSPKQ